MTSRHTSLFGGLPAPVKGSLTLYIFGPGFGESQVVALPDGKWMVVDSCKQPATGTNLPLELLRYFAVPAIDLLVVTHADLDHCDGLPEIIDAFKVERLWRYPDLGTKRALLLGLQRKRPQPRFAKMLGVMDAMRRLMKSGCGYSAGYGMEEWTKSAAVRVTCVAPCPSEGTYEMEQNIEMFDHFRDGGDLTPAEERRLMGEANRLSLAVVIWWGKIGVMLGGDVEHDPGNDTRGWRGVIGHLRQDEKLHLIQGLRLVKAAHHGSEGAFSEDAWTHHATPELVDLAVITRFNRGQLDCPDIEYI